MQNGNKCIIASSGRSLELLKQEFPTLVHEQIPEYGISYSTNAVSTFFKLLIQIPKAYNIKINEERLANTLVEKYNATYLIADNRFGMHSKLCKSIFITHQIRVRLPWIFRFLEYPFHLVNRQLSANSMNVGFPITEVRKTFRAYCRTVGKFQTAIILDHFQDVSA
jgi:hypothetical protein